MNFRIGTGLSACQWMIYFGSAAIAVGGGAGNGAAYGQTPSLSVVYTFSGGADGSHPTYGPLRLDGDGDLYGVTLNGGDLACPTGGYGCGVVFKIDTSGGQEVLYSFTDGLDGDLSYGGVIRDGAGILYGTTEHGGSAHVGTLYEIATNGTWSALYNFATGAGGNEPGASVVRDSTGALFGTTPYGGDASCTSGCGVIYRVDPDGAETVLHSFTGKPEDGQGPQSNLVRDAAGNLYGTTAQGGTDGYGTVFKLTPDGTETVLHSFASGKDGATPQSGLTLDRRGNVYGATTAGGKPGAGVVFKIDPAGHETLLYTFQGKEDGGKPCGGLVRDTSGNLYGTTCQGGGDAQPSLCDLGCGVIYRVSSDGQETVLYSFTGGADGANPNSGLVPKRLDGGRYELFGTTLNGGNLGCLNSNGEGCGTVFKLLIPGGAAFESE